MTSGPDSSTRFNIDGGIHEIPLPASRGRLWLCGKHFIAPRHQFIVAEMGIDTVVCLVERHELAHRYDPYIDWLVDNEDRGALWRPLHDLSFPPFDEAMKWIEPLHRMMVEGRNLVVHCAAGIGRAGTTATALAMLDGLHASDAIDLVRSHRPSAGPESGDQQRFIAQLQDELHGNTSSSSRLH